jgi:hypothetical protein
MKTTMIVASAVFLLAACGQQEPAKDEAPPAEPAVAEAPAAPRPAPLSLERTATCAAALDTFKGFGKGAPPAGMSIEQFGDAALITLRAIEVETADATTYRAALESAKSSWKDQTPADVETAVRACIAEIKG